MTDIWHIVEQATTRHPFWHICRKCISPIRLFLLAGAMNIFWEFATFMPVHRFFEFMGWIS